ncbi:MAG: PQQ-binding-like beta-propeller repeat protein [bacterium]
MIKSIMVLLLALYVVGNSHAIPIQGLVFEDKNGNGIQDAEEVGLANIGVSDGTAVALTDTKGKYNLPDVSSTATFVFVTTPSGYGYASTFYYLLDGQTTATNVDFALLKMKEKPSDYFVQVTDIHVGSASDAADFLNAITELNRLNPPPGFIISTGDLLNRGSDTTQYELYKDQINRSQVRWYNAFGNHDANTGENRAANYRAYLGPDYYSFDYGAYHFIVLNSVLTTAQQPWLQNDLRILGKTKPLIFMQHYPPQDPIRHDPIKNIPNAKALITGHWHSNKLMEENGHFYINTPPLRTGGIEASPAVYRIISIKGNEIKTELRPISKKVAMVTPVITEEISTISQPTTDWLMFQKDPSRNAISENLISPPLSLSWKTELKNSRVMLSSPLVKDKMLYLAIQNENEIGGSIVAINAVTGKIMKTAKTRLWINHTPAIYHQTLYTVDMGGRIYAFSLPALNLRWSYDLDDGRSHWIYSAPVVDAGRVYAGNAGKFVCLDAETGTPIWDKRYGSDWVSSWVTPSIANDTMYFGAIWNEENCFAADIKSGEILWNYKTGGVHTAPVPYKNTVYVSDANGKLSALDINTGQEIWATQLDKSWILSTPAISNGMIIAASGKGTIYAVDTTTGTIRWQVHGGEGILRMSIYQSNNYAIFSSPVISGKTVYIGSSDGYLYAIDILTGNVVWKQDFDSPIVSTPAIAGNTVYVVTIDGTVYAFCGRQ